MQVYYYDLVDKVSYGNAKKCNTLQELLQNVDLVTVHVDGRKANYHLIDEPEFALMKDGVFFLNASRGLAVHIVSLAQAIKSGKVGGAAVDVFTREPHKNGEGFIAPLQGLANVILTPHIGAATEEAQEQIGKF